MPTTNTSRFVCETVIAAPPAAIIGRLIDFSAYPTWIGELSRVQVVADKGQVAVVEFRTRVQVRDAIWKLRYRIDRDADRLAWHLLDSNLLAEATGSWQTETRDDCATTLHYQAEIALHLPVSPGVRNRVENIFSGPALKRGLGLLKQRLERTIP